MGDRLMRAPHPETRVRLHLAPPATTVQAGSAWRSTIQPRPRRARLSDIVALALCVALLGLFVWTLSTPEPEATRVIARAVAR